MDMSAQDPWNPHIYVQCARCGTPHECVRPGKTQPTCNCDDFCYMHDDPVRIEYRTEEHPSNDVASRAAGYGMHLGYVCPECFK